MIWYLSNLQGCSAALFLFGDAYQQHWKESEGIILAVLNPKTDTPDSGERHDDLSFSIQKPGQLMIIGHSKDFGKCQSVRKDGQPCGNVVNLSDCPYCQYHMASEFKKLSSKRPNLNNLGPTGAPRMLTVGMKQGIRKEIRNPQMKGMGGGSVNVLPPTDISSRVLQTAIKRRVPIKPALSEVLKDPKMINMLNKTRDGKRSIAAAHLKVIAGLQQQARQAGTSISEVLRRGPAPPPRPATSPSANAANPAGAPPPSARPPASSGPAPANPSAAPPASSRPAGGSSGRATDPGGAPPPPRPASGAGSHRPAAAARKQSGPSHRDRPEKEKSSKDAASEGRTSGGPAAAPQEARRTPPAPGGGDRPRPASADASPGSAQPAGGGGGGKPDGGERRAAMGATPVQARSGDAPPASPAAAPAARPGMLFLDDDDDDDDEPAGSARPVIVRCNQVLTPKALETRLLAAQELGKDGGLAAPEPNRVTKPTTLTVEALAERKRKRALLTEAEQAAARLAAGPGGAERDDGTLELGWIGSKKAVRRGAADVIAAVRDRRLAELFPELAQVVSTREGEEMLSRGSANVHLAQQARHLPHKHTR